MSQSREIDISIARLVFGFDVRNDGQDDEDHWIEVTPSQERPLKNYSHDMAAAWEVVERMNISLIPVEHGEWFAIVGEGKGWSGPAAFIDYLKAGNFVKAGAAVGAEPALTICIAALKAVEHRKGVLTVAAPDLAFQN